MGKPSTSGHKGSNKQPTNNMGHEKTPKFGNNNKFQETAGVKRKGLKK